MSRKHKSVPSADGERIYRDKTTGRFVFPSYVEDYISALSRRYPTYSVEVKPKKDAGEQKFAVYFNGDTHDYGQRLLDKYDMMSATRALNA